MKYDEIKRKCVDCGKEFIISSSQQSFYRVREWELPKRCKECREKKKQEWMNNLRPNEPPVRRK